MKYAPSIASFPRAKNRCPTQIFAYTPTRPGLANAAPMFATPRAPPTTPAPAVTPRSRAPASCRTTPPPSSSVNISSGKVIRITLLAAGLRSAYPASRAITPPLATPPVNSASGPSAPAPTTRRSHDPAATSPSQLCKRPIAATRNSGGDIGSTPGSTTAAGSATGRAAAASSSPVPGDSSGATTPSGTSASRPPAGSKTSKHASTAPSTIAAHLNTPPRARAFKASARPPRPRACRPDTRTTRRAPSARAAVPVWRDRQSSTRSARARWGAACQTAEAGRKSR
jgi:hypothetical protein